MSYTAKVLIAIVLFLMAITLNLTAYMDTRADTPVDFEKIRVCTIKATDIIALIESVARVEGGFLYATSETTPRMWWAALLGLNESLEKPLEKSALEKRVQELREGDYVLPDLKIFLELDGVSILNERNARDFFLYLTELCETKQIFNAGFQMDHVLSRAYASLSDRYSTYMDPRWISLEPTVETVRETTEAVAGEPTVFTGIHMLSENQYLIEIPSFESKQTSQRIRGLLEEIAQRCATPHLVLDLRNNRGGWANQATEVVASLLGKTLVFTAHYRDGTEVPFVGSTTRVSGLEPMSLLILVNRSTASSAEVVTAALEEWGAITIGEKTFGKGVAQEVITLKNGSEAHITTFTVYSPEHETWHQKGITPRINMLALPIEEASKEMRTRIERDLGPLSEDPGIVTSFRLIQESEAGTTSCNE